MQDFRSMMSSGGGGGGGGGGRIFGGERRLRPFPNQALKCPRCDSLNTKFCYYNNYNLSQPRHFCKSCRRYWTKGGVLRNVPVGGGCRKTKRSKPKTSTGESEKVEKKSTTSHSSSDSSSLTATTTTEAASSNSGGAAAAALVNFPESTLLSQNHPNSNLLFEQSMIQVNSSTTNTTPLDQATDKTEMFPETGGGFTGLMNASNPSPFLGFNFSEISPFRLNNHHHHHHQQQQQQQQQNQEQEEQMQQQKMVEDQLKFQELAKGLIYDQTVVPVDMHGLSNRGTSNGGGLTALDWQQSSNDHQGLFDLPNTSTVVDHHQNYWSQTSQWTENDHSLYLP